MRCVVWRAAVARAPARATHTRACSTRHTASATTLWEPTAASARQIATLAVLGELCGGGYANGVWRAAMPLTRMDADEEAPAAAPVVDVNADGSSQTQLSTGALVGIVVGGVALLALVVAGALMCQRRRQMLQPEGDVSYKAFSADS